MKYIIRKILCYLCKSKFGKREPSYNYGTHVDNYYEKFDEVINEFSDIFKNQINYDIHDLWENGLLDDNTYILFYYDNLHCYYGKINEPYLIFAKENFNFCMICFALFFQLFQLYLNYQC